MKKRRCPRVGRCARWRWSSVTRTAVISLNTCEEDIVSTLGSIGVGSAGRLGIDELVLLVLGIVIVVVVSLSLVLRLGYLLVVSLRGTCSAVHGNRSERRNSVSKLSK